MRLRACVRACSHVFNLSHGVKAEPETAHESDVFCFNCGAPSSLGVVAAGLLAGGPICYHVVRCLLSSRSRSFSLFFFALMALATLKSLFMFDIELLGLIYLHDRVYGIGSQSSVI